MKIPPTMLRIIPGIKLSLSLFARNLPLMFMGIRSRIHEFQLQVEMFAIEDAIKKIIARKIKFPEKISGVNAITIHKILLMAEAENDISFLFPVFSTKNMAGIWESWLINENPMIRPTRALPAPIERINAMKRGPPVKVVMVCEKIPSYITFFNCLTSKSVAVSLLTCNWLTVLLVSISYHLFIVIFVFGSLWELDDNVEIFCR